MPNEKILLKAKANQLGIDGYRKMGLDELKDAIARAEGKSSTPSKGKTTAKADDANGSKGKTAATEVVKGKTTTSTPAKGKTTAPAKGKSTSRKTTPAKASAAKGKASRAASTPAKGKATPAKGKATTPAKGKASTAKSKPRGSAKALPARVDIDRSKIDWTADSNVGKSGKRADVMKALRKRKGNYDKVFEDLAPNAVKYYPNALNSFPDAPSKRHAAERMLRWLINRVAFDFVKTTGQHTPGERTKYGKSKAPQDIRRRERREEARKEREKAERAAKRAKDAAKKARGKK